MSKAKNRKETKPNEGFRFEQEIDLPLLCEELYDNNWCVFYANLNQRLEKRPAVYKLTGRIKEDLVYITENFIFELTSEEFDKQISGAFKYLKLSRNENINKDEKITKQDIQNEPFLADLVNMYSNKTA